MSTTATAATDLLIRAEHAALAVADTWDADRAARLVTLADRYAARAVAITLAEKPLTTAVHTARRVARTAGHAARQQRVLARSLELGQGPTD